MEAKSVSEQDKWLLIDIGNTAIKYAVVDHHTPIDNIAIAHTDDLNKLVTCLAQVQHVALAYVREPHNLNMFIDVLHIHGKHVQIAQTQAKTMVGGMRLVNSYHTPENMGVDRWLAMIAGVYFAQQAQQHSVLVIDAGTAITCDVIVQGKHKGGFIAPGFSLLQTALLQDTEKVFSSDARPEHISLGQDTPECVINGCLAQLHGTVTAAQQQIEQYTEDYIIVLSGGDQKLLNSYNQKPQKTLANLVLCGLCLTFVHK
jgi:type III pantothenate kinase